ncbi:Ig-like domain-containing protein [Cyclonatronum proteinivorum]|nr:hypothetical protein [Cyclonatronum proteinivorum]
MLTDQNGSPVFAPWPGITVNLFSTEADGLFFADAEGSTAVNSIQVMPATSQQTIYYEAQQPGTYEIQLSAEPLLPVSGILPLEVQTGAPDPAMSEITLNDGFVNQEPPIRAELRDVAGFPVQGQSERLTASVVSGVNAGVNFGPFQETAAGIYESFYLPQQAGNDEIRFFLDDDDFTGQAYFSQVLGQMPARMEAVSETFFSSLILSETETPFRVRVLDEEDQPLEGISVRFLLVSRPAGEGVAGDSLFTSQAFTDATGIAETRFRMGFRAGLYVTEARLGNLQPVVFEAVAVGCELEDSSDLTGFCGPYSFKLQPSSELLTPGDSVFVHSQLIDRYGNPSFLEGLNIAWSSTGSGSFRVEQTTTDAQGRADNAWLPEPVAGSSFRMTATAEQEVSGQTPELIVAGSTLRSLQFSLSEPSTAGRFSEVVTFVLKDSMGTEILAPETLVFRLEADNSEQFSVKSGTLPDQLVISPNQRVRFETGRSRSYARISQTKSGLFALKAQQVQGLTAIDQAEVLWEVEAGPADFISSVSNLEITGTAGSVPAELPAVLVKDTFGNPSSGQPVNFSLLRAPPDAGTVIVGPVPDNGDISGSRFQYTSFTDENGISNSPFLFGQSAGLYELEARIDTGDFVNFFLTAKPSRAQLNQNYPNPFRSHTRIPFEIPYASSVHLNVYDVLGRRVQTLISDEHYDPGVYQYDWHPRMLAAGVYYIRLILIMREGESNMMVRPVMYLP